MKENRELLLDMGNMTASSAAGAPRIDNTALSEEEKRRMRRAALIKMLVILIVAAAVIVFSSLSWFSMNKENNASGMGVRVGSDAYQIVPVNGQDSIFQGYYDYINNYSTDALVWKMTDESNLENYTDDVGISPGAYGAVSFYVKPRNEMIDLDLTFDITGYAYTAQSEDSDTHEITPAAMTLVSNDLQKYLAGHIFLFQNREPVYDKPEDLENRKIVSYLYSNPILSGADLSKVISDRTFTRANQDIPVNIYWVWPKTLSTLVDATANNNVIIEPFSTGTDRTAIENNIAAYPNYYFYDYTDTTTTLTSQKLSDEYDTYGDLYDRADNEIGMKVSYITLKMTTNESSQNAQD